MDFFTFFIIFFCIIIFLVILWFVLHWALSGVPCECNRDMHGKHAVITGATSGMGVFIAHRLAKAGANIVLLVRRPDAANALADELHAKYPQCGEISVVCADLSDLQSVYDAIPKIKNALLIFDKNNKSSNEEESTQQQEDSKEPKLHLLVNNAGVLLPPMKETSQGLEPHFGVNYMASFVLTSGLLPCLRASGSDARVVCVSSLTYKLALFKLGGLKESLFTFKKILELGENAPAAIVRYAHSKLAVLMFVLALGRKEACLGTGVRAFAVDPGVALTSITRNMPKFVDKIWLSLHIGRNAEMGAQTAIHCSLADEDQLKNGMYKSNHFVNCWPEVYSEQAQDLFWNQTEQLLQTLNLPVFE